jgi:hypothetical protein
LEVGAGTGFYTSNLATRVKAVEAQEPSEAMSKILKSRIALGKITNTTVINDDVFSLDRRHRADHVVAIGVLDYIADWEKFLGCCLELSDRTLIFTAPQKGFWSQIYAAGGRINGTRISRYSASNFQNFFSKFNITIIDTGLKSALLKGITLVVVVEKKRLDQTIS